jgi:KDO2-lipid IV(A) lauroyltransferase
MYLHFGMNLIDFLRLPLLTQEEFREDDSKRVRVDGLSHLRETLRQGKGALMLSAHFGNWELLSAWMVRQGHPTNIIAKRIRQPALNQFCLDIRRQVGVHSIHKKNAIREIIEKLKKNELVGFVLDQRVNEREGVVVQFFGRPAGTISGLALLSLRYDLPVLPVFIHREADLEHRLSIGAPVILPLSGDRDKDIRNLTQKYSDILEQQVRLHPEQWIWLHKRWNA